LISKSDHSIFLANFTLAFLVGSIDIAAMTAAQTAQMKAIEREGSTTSAEEC
jgi:hypothetical protein